MIIRLKRKTFSNGRKNKNLRNKDYSPNKISKLTLIDEDYLKDIEDESKSSQSAIKTGRTILGGALGSFGGTVLGTAIGKSPRALLVGTAAGTAAGAYLGHKWGKRGAEKEAAEHADHVEKYKNASPRDREYFRNKREKNIDREWGLMQAQAGAPTVRINNYK